MHSLVECEGCGLNLRSINAKKCKTCIERRLEGSCEYAEETNMDFRKRINFKVEGYMKLITSCAWQGTVSNTPAGLTIRCSCDIHEKYKNLSLNSEMKKGRQLYLLPV